MGGFVLGLLGLLAWSTIGPGVVQAQVGYALAHSPEAASYRPNTAYSYNASRPVLIRRTSTGRYVVRFLGLGRPTAGSHVQVSSVGHLSTVCTVADWDHQVAAAPQESLYHFDVTVQCYDLTGHPTDSRFTVMAGWFTDGGGAGAIPRLDRIGPTRLPGTGGKADYASVADVETLVEMINALYEKIEEMREQLNKLAG
jgi:hypothetical protein